MKYWNTPFQDQSAVRSQMKWETLDFFSISNHISFFLFLLTENKRYFLFSRSFFATNNLSSVAEKRQKRQLISWWIQMSLARICKTILNAGYFTRTNASTEKYKNIWNHLRGLWPPWSLSYINLGQTSSAAEISSTLY